MILTLTMQPHISSSQPANIANCNGCFLYKQSSFLYDLIEFVNALSKNFISNIIFVQIYNSMKISKMLEHLLHWKLSIKSDRMSFQRCSIDKTQILVDILAEIARCFGNKQLPKKAFCSQTKSRASREGQFTCFPTLVRHLKTYVLCSIVQSLAFVLLMLRCSTLIDTSMGAYFHLSGWF